MDNIQHANSNSSRNDDEWTREEEALRNPIILQNMFAHLPTTFLLKSCSLVNKNWNGEARKFVRDRRKCLGMKPGYSWLDESPCELLRQLDIMCGSIAAQGRIVPWNSLKLKLLSPRKCLPECNGNGEETIYENLKSNLKISFLEVRRSIADCSVHKPFLNLLHFYSHGLKSLTLGGLPPHVLELFNSHEYPLKFPKLEEIAILSSDLRRELFVEQKQILRKMLKGALNLRRIVTISLHDLEIVPEGLYKLLVSLDFYFRSFKDEYLFRAIIESKPALSQLSISEPEVPRILTVQRYPNSARHHQLPQTFATLLAQLLATCGQSLKHLYLRGSYQLHKLPCFPQLYNLSKLTIRKQNGQNLEEFWRDIVCTLDFAKTAMPNLLEMEIVIYVLEAPSVQNQTIVEASILEWPRQNLSSSCSSASVLKLELHAKVISINVSLLKSTFPNVDSLELSLNAMVYLPIFTKLFEIWQDMKELTVTLTIGSGLMQNFDAEFCGIHQEEVDLLKEKDEKYLRAVRIVPIRPSLLTMRKLRTLLIDLKVQASSVLNHPEAVSPVVSKLTKLIALKHIRDAKVSITSD